MEDISKIIQEAKPLYFARKRKRKIVFSASAVVVCAVLINLTVSLYKTTLPVYDLWSEDVYLTENSSVIEDMGLPVDEYGLLMVG